MPLPAGIPLVTVTGNYTIPASGAGELTGSVTFTPVPDRVASAAYGVILLGSYNATLTASGGFTARLVSTDVGNFVWRMDENVTGLPPQSRNITLPASGSPVDLVAFPATDAPAATYTVITGPRGPQGTQGPPGAGGGVGALAIANNLSDLASAPSARSNLGLGTAATVDTSTLVLTSDTRLTDARTPAGTASGDLSGPYPSPTVAKISGVAVSGAASSGKVLTASSSAAASWQTPIGGGGGSTIRTAGVRVTDDNLAGLPSAAAWAVVQTSAGTKLQRAIAAAAGDRIKVYGAFMRNGSHFLDWALLDSAGAIALYAGSESSSPLSEGNPALYPSFSFSYATSADMFTVASGHISGGNVTVALAHQGTGSGLVYAHSTYPFRLRLENIGPEPA